jgi:hypothetical protein
MFTDFGYWFEETGKTILMTVGSFVAFVLLLVFGAIPVANAVSDATAEGYSGHGVIREAKVAGSFCYATVDVDNGTKDDFIVGPRAICSKSLEGQQVTIDRGRLRK